MSIQNFAERVGGAVVATVFLAACGGHTQPTSDRGTGQSLGGQAASAGAGGSEQAWPAAGVGGALSESGGNMATDSGGAAGSSASDEAGAGDAPSNEGGAGGSSASDEAGAGGAAGA